MNDTRATGAKPLVLTIALLLCIAVLSAAYYLQHVENLEPCPWCIAQRILFMAIGLLALCGLVHRGGRRAYAYAGALFSLAGVAAAAYHLWLQSRPERIGSCVGGWLETTLDMTRLGMLWPEMFQYEGPCVLAPWDLLGLSIPEWSLASFVALSAGMIEMAIMRRKY